MSRESYLTSVLQEGAETKKRSMKPNLYLYKIYKEALSDEIVAHGICKVTDCQYDRGLDCNVYSIIDMQTKEKYSAHQFRIDFIELDE